MKKSFLKSSALMFMTPFFALGGCSNSTSSLHSDKEVGYQLELPQKNEEIAIVNTSMGQFKLRFFPEAAPKAV